MILHQNVEHDAVLIDRTPEIVPLVDPEKHLVEMPVIARSRPPSAQLIGEAPAELQAPTADALVGDEHASFGQQQLNIPQAQAEYMIQPHSMGDDLGWEAV